MLDHGVSRTSLEAIARRANVSRGAIYWHFKDKTALLEAMVQRTAMPLRELRDNLDQQMGEDAGSLAVLREMLLHGISRLANDAQHRRVCHIVLHRCEATDHSQVTECLINSMFEDSHTVLLSLCHDVAQTHALRAPLSCEDACDIIMAFMVGTYECSLRHPSIYSANRGMATKVDALLAGLFPSQERPKTSAM